MEIAPSWRACKGLVIMSERDLMIPLFWNELHDLWTPSVCKSYSIVDALLKEN